MTIHEKIADLLEIHDIKFKTFEHEPVSTSEEAAAIRNSPLERGAKAMIMRSEKKFFMVVISAAKNIDLKKLKNIINTESLSFATPEEVKEITGCEVGGVPPFGNIFNLHVYLDKSLIENEIIDFNSGEKTKSIEMNLNDYIRLVNPQIVDIGKDKDNKEK